MDELAFVVLSVFTVAAAILSLESRELIYGAISLALTLLGLAGFFIILDAIFVALFQILVYIGAVAVLIIFTVMLVARGRQMERTGPEVKSMAILGGLLTAIAFGAIAVQSNLATWLPSTAEPLQFQLIGVQMLTQYWFAFVVLAIVLAAAVIGALTMAKVEKE